MVVVPAAVVAHRTGVLRNIGEDVFYLLALKRRASYGGVEVVGVRSVVLGMVDFHGARVDVGFQSGVGVGKFW